MEYSKYKFECGCEVKVVDSNIKECDGLPALKLDYYNLPDCPATWDLIGSGFTKGVFQLESSLGQTWAKKIMPRSVNEMAALVSLMRPGCLRAIVDGKSMTHHYADRKSGAEEVTYFHDALIPILQETYGVLAYQEQSMKIATDIAGASLQEADILRKAIGKKQADTMSKVEGGFMEGCKKTGIVTEEEAKEIYGWIRESQRYAFNKSHGVCYGDMGYMSAYAKAHFPMHFFCSWLYYAHEKIDPQEEIRQLVSDAKNFDVSIYPPDLRRLHKGDVGHFSLEQREDGQKIVYFGAADIKKIGMRQVEKMLEKVQHYERLLGKTIDKWTWNDFLIQFSDEVSQTVVNGLIAAGATDYMDGSRSRKTFEFNQWRELTKKEREFVKELGNVSNLKDSLQTLVVSKSNLTVNRKAKINEIIEKKLQNPTYSLEDTAYTIAENECEMLGIPITQSRLDMCKDLPGDLDTCKEFLNGKDEKMVIAVEIIECKPYTIKRGKQIGKKMAFLKVEDETTALDSVVAFPDMLEKFEKYLRKGSTVILTGQRDRNRKDSFIISNVKRI